MTPGGINSDTHHKHVTYVKRCDVMTYGDNVNSGPCLEDTVLRNSLNRYPIRARPCGQGAKLPMRYPRINVSQSPNVSPEGVK
jgi:hypothetical protein